MAEKEGEDKSLKSPIAQSEEKVLEFWKTNQIFEKTLEKKSPKGEFIFYDGPVTANAKPVFHTMEPFAFKDVIPRYRTMRGFHVDRKGGWDTHGLPVELQIEKKLGFTSKKDIENFGIAEFNKLCKESVWEYIGFWKDFTDRMGYWADQKNPYITYENEYIESAWNVVKTVNDKKLLYKDYKVLPWCPRCGTGLSSHELALGYQDDKDLSVTAKFKVVGEDRTYLLAWTTTPWTLPGNVALAVGNDIDYVKIKVQEDFFILAKLRLSIVTENYEIVEEMKGEKLVGLKYEHLYHFLADKFDKKDPIAFEKSYQVYAADFVNTEDGTGIVHTAVMYGQDDFVLGSKIGLPKHHLVKDDGHFHDGMDFLSNRFVKDEEVAVDIVKDLAHRGLLFKKEKHEHSYPHCWRCKTPLIYYARDSWYIAMSKLRDELIEENEEINWEPEHIKEGRFGEWLRGIKDWALSRERYWGTPLPVWVDSEGNHKVIGSIPELKKYAKKSGNKYMVLRHGQSTHNINWGISSEIDNQDSLTEKGIEETKAAAKNLKNKIDLIVISPFKRIRESAQIVKEVLGLGDENIIEDDRLVEFGIHSLNGKSWTEYHGIFPKTKENFDSKRDGDESYKDVKVRAMSVLYDYESRYQNKNILFITHGAVGWLMTAGAMNLNLDETYAMINPENNSHLDDIKNGELRELDFVPLPHNDNFEVDLHKPYIDSLELVDENGKTLTRVKEVMDVWFDSGVMPFAQHHYPWQKGKLPYPADFISEAIDQTRGWFYTLHAVGILMGEGKAYKNVICLGHILDKEGKKMSKSIGNIVDPWIVINKYGADAIRLWMYTVNQPGDSKNFDEKSLDEVNKKVFNPIINIALFYEMYKDSSIVAHNKSKSILDRWILSRLGELVSVGTRSMDEFKVFEGARPIRDFVNDFSTWYVRRSRERFKSDDVEDKSDALSTTLFVLKDLARYMSPFTPFFAEEIYQKIKSDTDSLSVHLENWPASEKVDSELLAQMEKVRSIVTKALELRQKAGHKIRQPLQSLTVPENVGEEFNEIIKDEINVKEVLVVKDGKIELDTNITPELKDEGVMRDIVRIIQDSRKTKGLLATSQVAGTVTTSIEVGSIVEKYSDVIKKATNLKDMQIVLDKDRKDSETELIDISFK